MIIRSRTVVPIVGEPIENGAVAINGNTIAEVGPFKEVSKTFRGDVIDLGEQILLPGLINAHCHLDYTMLRGKIPPQQTFTDWIRSINRLKAALKEEDYLNAINAGLAEARNFGTTSIVNLEAFPELLRRIETPELRVWWCAEMIDVRTPVSVDCVEGELRKWLQSSPRLLGGVGLAPHAPYTASAQLFSQAAALGQKQNLILTTHLAESTEEMEMFRDASGPLYRFLQEIGRAMNDCGETPISLMTRTLEMDERWIVAHLNEITENDFELLARQKRFHLVHCPSSHTFFRHSPFPFHRLHQLGFNICLGTDSLASNSSLSLFSEMRELLRKEQGISARQALTMATINGAKAIGAADRLGQIRPGSAADLIAILSPSSDNELFESIAAFEGEVGWMMIAGRILTP